MRDDFPTQLTFDEAQAIVDATAAEDRLPAERLAIARTQGRILAQEVVAPIPQPPFDNSAMDGYAIRHADVAEGGTTLQLAGEQFAGRALDLRVEPGQCIRITTGAPMPAGADTVVVREVVRVEGDRIAIPAGIRAQANVRRAGEDVRIGDCVLSPGQVLTPARVATTASLGIDQLTVSARPTVAVFTTGDELIPPGIPLEPGQIHDSNRELLMGLLRADGLEPTAWPTLPDDPVRIASMLRDAASSFDVVITCGAVSAGEKDHIPALLDTHGRIHFWKVRMKPGMPVLFGDLGTARFLGLPGNPVSVFATYATLGRRLLDGLQGRTEPRRAFRARLAAPIDKAHARREFVRGRLEATEDGTLRAHPDAATGSHRLHAAAMADALIVVPEGPRQLSIGDVVDVLPY
ncbi:Molybdopterin biosynthesis protein MoeA [Lysobacter dokdonensis DS-58]|uniref:Molybdopterin molybdenumtransferase n=1 Tax=Lysobacter dokdonensis DS-58 TaxID=1300345 RepID=A0A0A2X1C2_9GAMM|nr:gephyrin-like molybdotransferase Glp [Lysobacter dokdonensis]KGQ19019.1 Molybdopterin biosynthesis protein MoeA [Lysobacter dokdonensis DS-58]